MHVLIEYPQVDGRLIYWCECGRLMGWLPARVDPLNDALADLLNRHRMHAKDEALLGRSIVDSD